MSAKPRLELEVEAILNTLDVILQVYGSLVFLTPILTEVHKRNVEGRGCPHSRRIERYLLDAFKLAIECEGEKEDRHQWDKIVSNCEAYLNAGH